MDPYDHDLERGLRNRRAMLGDAWVDKSAGGASDFSADFQAFITRYAWHEVWGRPGLDAATRRIVVLATTCALGRWEEFDLHCRAALSAGDPASRISVAQLKEILLQMAIYAGVPAANTAMSRAGKILAELGRTPPARALADVFHPGTGRSARSAGTPALHYTLRTPRDVDRPRHTVVLSHALGCDLSMWDGLANSLASDCQVVCFDHRGHGDSDAPDGPYTMAGLADDAARLIAELGCGPVVWVGISLGGMVGQELALAHPGLLRGLVIANATSGYDAAALDAWRQRIATVERQGIEAVADGTMQRWFTEAFRAANPATVARWRRRAVSTDRRGYLGACHAAMNVATTERLPRIALPTLVIAADQDAGTPPAMSELIARQIPNARLTVLTGVAHLSALEAPAAFEAAVRGFVDAA